MKLAALLVALAACGGAASTGRDAPGPGDAPPPIDAAPPVDAAPPIDAPPPPLGCATAPSAGTRISMVKVAQVSGAAVLLTAPPRDPRQFVVEQAGRIRVIKDGALVATPFLDLTPDVGGPVVAGGERGLLGLAFHPAYAQNGLFFVYYTTATANVVARYRVSAADPDRADPAGTVVLAIDDFAPNHNGGMLEFGPDGMLYVGTGDGGGANDPQLTGQDPSRLLGKLLRLDVDHPGAGLAYGIPAGNPFAGGGGRGEIYHLGLRNPWRWSFDAATGDLWIGDVGQNAREELDVVRAGAGPGQNFGWSTYEGTACFHAPCDPAGKAMPAWEVTHAQGWCAIIGGGVYRGACFPDLVGTYFFTDSCKAELWQTPATGAVAPAMTPGALPASPASLHADARGELYLTTTAGGVYHLTAAP